MVACPSFFVYRLRDERDGTLLYVGRSMHPKIRMRVFQKRTGRVVVISVMQRYSTFEQAASTELALIRQLRPPYNLNIESSPGNTGYRFSEVQRRRMSEKHKGAKHTEEHKAKIASSIKAWWNDRKTTQGEQ